MGVNKVSLPPSDYFHLLQVKEFRMEGTFGCSRPDLSLKSTNIHVFLQGSLDQGRYLWPFIGVAFLFLPRGRVEEERDT